MDVVNALASLAVSDLDEAVTWYGRFLGTPSRPMDDLAEWALDGGGALQVYALPERAGRGSCTLIVPDVPQVAAELERCGIGNLDVVSSDLVDVVMVRDPDGNSIAFSAPKAGVLAR